MNIESLAIIAVCVFGVVAAVALFSLLFEKPNRRIREEHLYKQSIVDVYEFEEDYIPKIFASQKEINLFVLSKYLSMPKHTVITNLSKEAMKPVVVDFKPSLEDWWDTQPDSYETVFKILEACIKNELPTYIFIEIGKDATYHQNVDGAMRAAKENFPNIHFYIFCSSFYFRDKAAVIDSLIKDGTAENLKVTDSAIVLSQREGMIKKIQECLQ